MRPEILTDVLFAVKASCNTTETFYVLLYPIEPGLFNVFFMRPEKSLHNLHSMIAVHQASFPHAKSGTLNILQVTIIYPRHSRL